MPTTPDSPSTGRYTPWAIFACLIWATAFPAVKTGLVFVSAAVFRLLFLLIQYVQDPGAGILDRVVAQVVPAAFYTALVTPIVFLILDSVFRRHTACGTNLNQYRFPWLSRL